MKAKKTTVQDIADSLGFSRTTVSKALNDADGVSSKTKELVRERARELGYKTFRREEAAADTAPSAPVSPAGTGNIALFLNMIPDSFHMSSYLMMSLEQALGKLGYSLSLHLITEVELKSMTLPASFHVNNVDAIFCLEIFDEAYSRFICSLGKPVLFSDTYSTFEQGDLPADVLVADNFRASVKLYSSIIEETHPKTIGYMGVPDYSLSFYDRFKGFLELMNRYTFADDYKKHSIIASAAQFQDDLWLERQFKTIELPKLLVCSNDVFAMKALTNLERMNLKVPNDIMVCGYDGTPAISSLYPSLTTIIAPSQEMGVMAAEMLSHKIKNPSLPNMIVTMNSRILKNTTTQKRASVRTAE